MALNLNKALSSMRMDYQENHISTFLKSNFIVLHQSFGRIGCTLLEVRGTRSNYQLLTIVKLILLDH